MSQITELRKHTVDTASSKYHLLPPTAFQLASLAKNSRTTKPVAESWVADGFITRNLRRRLGPKVIEELVKRYIGGEHTTDLSQKFGTSTSGMRQLLLEEGVTLRRQSMARMDINQAVQLYESGLTIREIVTEIGFSLGSIRLALHQPAAIWNLCLVAVRWTADGLVLRSYSATTEGDLLTGNDPAREPGTLWS